MNVDDVTAESAKLILLRAREAALIRALDNWHAKRAEQDRSWHPAALAARDARETEIAELEAILEWSP